MHAAALRLVEIRMRPGFLGLIAARHIEHQRLGAVARGQMQVARDDGAIPRDIDVFDLVGGEFTDLVIAAHQAAVQITLFVIGLKYHVLCIEPQQGGLVVEFHRGIAVTGLSFGFRHFFEAACGQPHVLADHVVVAHIARQAAATVGLEVEDVTGFLDHPVKDPFLAVALQMGTAGFLV